MGDWAAQADFSPWYTNFHKFKFLLYSEIKGETGHLYTTKLFKLVTFLDELFLLTLLSEQLLLTQCCRWLISCILGITEANVTWLERKSLLIHPCMEGKPRGFRFCSSRAKVYRCGLRNTLGSLRSALFGSLLQSFSLRPKAMAENCRIQVCSSHSMKHNIILAKQRVNNVP